MEIRGSRPASILRGSSGVREVVPQSVDSGYCTCLLAAQTTNELHKGSLDRGIAKIPPDLANEVERLPHVCTELGLCHEHLGSCSVGHGTARGLHATHSVSCARPTPLWASCLFYTSWSGPADLLADSACLRGQVDVDDLVISLSRKPGLEAGNVPS